jgi:hypothetical protein
MSNVLSTEKQQQVIALGKLGWSVRRIEQATGVRRETASAYLRAAGVVVCMPGWGRRKPSKPAIEVTTDSDPAKAAMVTTDPGQAKPAIEVTADFGGPFQAEATAPSTASSSACAAKSCRPCVS